MIRIHPEIQNLFDCPVCAAALDLRGFAVTGMRNLVEGACAACRRRFLVDMPTDQALFTPVAVDPDAREVFDPAQVRWFSDLLLRSLDQRSDDAIPIVKTRNRDADRLLLVNCLDYIYGHAFEKLLNVQRFLDHPSDLAVWLLVPRPLAHLVPEGVAEVWTVDLPWRRLAQWNVSLEQQVRERAQASAEAYLAVTYPQLHASHYDLDRFLGAARPAETAGLGSPVVAFAYREDRLWGGSINAQQHNIEQLHRLLAAAYPGLSFVLVGFGRKGAFPPAIVDRRTDRFDPAVEQSWLRLLARADCAIGVHGSNMILPSALARHVVELMPVDRFANFLQDLQFAASIDPAQVLFRYRLIYGSRTLEDVRPEIVAALVQTQIDRADWFDLINGREHQPLRASPADTADLRAWIQDLRGRRLALRPPAALPEIPAPQPAACPGIWERLARRLLRRA